MPRLACCGRVESRSIIVEIRLRRMPTARRTCWHACRYRKVTGQSRRIRATFSEKELTSAAAKQIWICRQGSSNWNLLPSAPLPEQRAQPALPWFACDNRRRALAAASSFPTTGSFQSRRRSPQRACHASLCRDQFGFAAVCQKTAFNQHSGTFVRRRTANRARLMPRSYSGMCPRSE